MGTLGMVDWCPRGSGRTWPAGMPSTVMIVQHDPWSGYAWSDAAAKIRLMDSEQGGRQPFYVRYVYHGDTDARGSTPLDSTEIADAEAFIDWLLGNRDSGVPRFPEFHRARGWLICNEPNLEGAGGAGIPARFAAAAANRIKNKLHQYGQRVGTPPPTPFAPRSAEPRRQYDVRNEHVSRSLPFPAEYYLLALIEELDPDFDFIALHAYGDRGAGVGGEEPFQGGRESETGRWYPWGTNCLRAQLEVIDFVNRAQGRAPRPFVVDEWNTDAHDDPPSVSYLPGWLQNAVRYAQALGDKTLGQSLEAFLWFTGDGAGAWSDRSLKDRLGAMNACRMDFDYLVDAGV